MSAAIYRRCGCLDQNGKAYRALSGAATDAQKAFACPRLISDPNHGSWGFYISNGRDPKTDKRRQIRKAGFATKKAAQIARNKTAVKVDTNVYVAPTKDTLGNYLDRWLPRHARTAQSGTGLRPTTHEAYARYIKNDIQGSALAAMRLGDIRRHHVVTFFDELAKAGRGVPTLHRVLVVLQAALSSAVDDELIENHPAIRIPMEAERPKKFEAWTAEQVGHFLDVAVQHRLGAFYEIAFLTGMRRGELVGLKWSKVDLSTRALRVESTRVQTASGVIEGAPKTEKGERVVTLDDTATGALIAWKLRQDDERAAWGKAYVENDYVFTYENGEPLKPDYATRLFEKLRVKAGLPKITLHGARHEHASLWIEGGGDITLLSKRLGHASSRITSDIYVSRVGDADRTSAEQVAALIPRKKDSAHRTHTNEAIPSEPEASEFR